MKDLHPRARQIIDNLTDRISTDGEADELAQILSTLPPLQKRAHLDYWDFRWDGAAPKMAEMLALQAPPMLGSCDRTFLEGKVDNSDIFGGGPLAESMGERYKAVAEAGGQNVKGKAYIGGLARFPGDPEAWVSDRGDVKRVIERRGWRCTGSVEMDASSRNNELAAMYREAKPHMGPGLDRDEDGVVDTPGGEPGGEVIEMKLAEAA